MKLVTKVLMIYIVLYLTVVVHEAFHFAFAKILNVEVTKFVIGIGKPIIDVNIKGTNFVFNILPIGGYNYIDVTKENYYILKNKLLLITTGGIIGNLILGITSQLILIFTKPSHNIERFLKALVIANLVAVVLTLIRGGDKVLFKKILDDSIFKELK